jgi:hypothetical protein
MVKIGGYEYSLSPRKDFKLRTKVNGKTIDFGRAGYQHFNDKTGLLDKSLNHGDLKRRANYLTRSAGIKDGKGRLTKDNPEFANYHARRLLWNA